MGIKRSYTHCVDHFMTRQKDCCLCASLIDDHQNAIIAARYWKIRDQIHGDGLEGVLPLLMHDRQYGRFGAHCVQLGALAYSTPSYIGSGELSYLRPPELSYYCRYCYDHASRTIIFLLYSLSLALRTIADYAPSLLSITCLTLALTVLHTRASVPADVHPLCTVHARFPHRYLMYHCTFGARFPTP